jgi:hypothetical protein
MRNVIKVIISAMFIFVFIIFIFIMGMMATQSDKDLSNKTDNVTNRINKPVATIKSEILQINSIDLISVYLTNEVDADAKYKGRQAQIEGTIESINIILGQTSISLSGSDFNFVICYLKDKNDASGLSKGQNIKIEGIIDGYGIGSVTVNNCKVVK